MDLHLLKEDSDSYQIGHPETGKKMSIPKKGLSPKAHELIKSMKPQHFDEGGGVEEIAPEAQPGMDAVSAPVVPQAPMTPMNPVAPAAPVVPVTAGASGGWDAPPAPAQQAQDPLVQNKLDIERMLNNEEQAVNDYTSEVSNIAGNQAAAYKDYADKLDASATPDKIAADYKAKDDILVKAYADGKIDPNRYVHNMGTGSKIASAIGMILGGAGAAAYGGRNLGVEALDKAINNDIDAQKNDQGKALNLYRMNHEAMGDAVKAHMATQNQLWSGVQAKILGAQAQMQSPQAKLNAQKALVDIEERKAQNRMRLGLLSQGADGSGLSTADPAQLVESMVQDPAAKKQVYEEIGKAQNIGMNGQKMLDYFDQAAKDNTVMSTGAGLIRTPGSVMALHQTMLPNFKNIDGTVRQAAMDESFHNLTPMPGDSASKIAEKRQALQDWMHSEIAAPTAKGHGIDVNRFVSTSPAAEAHLSPESQRYLTWARANPSNPKAQIVFKKLGVR